MTLSPRVVYNNKYIILPSPLSQEIIAMGCSPRDTLYIHSCVHYLGHGKESAIY